MNFLGFAWIVSYVGSFFVPQTMTKAMDSVHHLFAPAPIAQTQACLLPSPLRSTCHPRMQQVAIAQQNAGMGFQRVATTRLRSARSGKSLERDRPQAARQLPGLFTRLSPWGRRPSLMFTPLVVVARKSPTPNHPPSRVSAVSPLLTRQCTSEARSIYPTGSQLQDIYEVKVRGQTVAELTTRASAEDLAQALRRGLQDPAFTPESLRPSHVHHKAAGMAGDLVLFEVEPDVAAALRRNADLLAIDWVNNLRRALNVPVLPLAEAQLALHQLTPTDKTLTGLASWYGPWFHNRPTAMGEQFDQNDLTAAHKTLPFGTYLKVTNLLNQTSVVVRINDRGPYVGERSLDLSRQAARCIGSEMKGVVPYKAVIMKALPNPDPNPAWAIDALPSPERPQPIQGKLAQTPVDAPGSRVD